MKKEQKNIIIAVVATLVIIGIGVAGYLVYQEQNKSGLEKAGDKTAEFGEKIGDWGKDVGKSTKKLFN